MIDGRTLYDSGAIHDMKFDIVDGKKIYKKYAPCNRPMPAI